MRLFTLRSIVALTTAFAVVSAGLSVGRAADPVTVELLDRASVGRSVVTIGDVARITGGAADTRARVARIDLADLKPRDPVVAIGRRSVEYRLALAGFEAGAVRVSGADRAMITVARRNLTAEEVTAAAREELLRQGAYPPEGVTVELAVPLIVKLPEVPADERPVITGKPRNRAGTTGRVQVDMSVAVAGETLLSFAVHLDVKPVLRPGVPTAPAVGTFPPLPTPSAPAASADPVIRPRERVLIQVVSGGLKATQVGEAQQAGKIGQIIFVQNVDSKKTISARVTGPGTVEIDLGGAP